MGSEQNESELVRKEELQRRKQKDLTRQGEMQRESVFKLQLNDASRSSTM